MNVPHRSPRGARRWRHRLRSSFRPCPCRGAEACPGLCRLLSVRSGLDLSDLPLARLLSPALALRHLGIESGLREGERQCLREGLRCGLSIACAGFDCSAPAQPRPASTRTGRSAPIAPQEEEVLLPGRRLSHIAQRLLQLRGGICIACSLTPCCAASNSSVSSFTSFCCAVAERCGPTAPSVSRRLALRRFLLRPLHRTDRFKLFSDVLARL